MQDNIPDWPRASTISLPGALFREQAADFQVTEELGFEPTGEGDHLFVLVEKEGVNTAEVGNLLARTLGCHPRDVGYAGMKDRVAITRQWFSLKSDGMMANDTLLDGKVRILEQHRNVRKLRIGSHKGNRFVIRLRDMTGDISAFEEHLAAIRQQGVPNYFGPQRFGRSGANIEKAVRLFSGTSGKIPRFQRGVYLSAARAFLFNQVLARRVTAGNWNTRVSGDVMLLAGTSSFFKAADDDQALDARLACGDIHPTGPMWGKGSLPVSGQARHLEESVIAGFEDFSRGLEQAGLKQERRALRVLPGELSMQPAGQGELVVEFSLPRGGFATSVIRELVTATGL